MMAASCNCDQLMLASEAAANQYACDDYPDEGQAQAPLSAGKLTTVQSVTLNLMQKP